ncbi:hypothetical protein LJR164_001641 [Phenylobacterium sp. LjRoot164]|uniref:hypothetical protein n=1 Tax=unclassified Phenylobacterium TaxID=2640670 RepID=UPI003ECDC4D8
MALTLFEYEAVSAHGEPLQPPAARRTALASGQAHRLGASTVYAAIVPGVNTYVRISETGAAATSADHFVPAGETRGFPVQKRSRPYVYGLDAA